MPGMPMRRKRKEAGLPPPLPAYPDRCNHAHVRARIAGLPSDAELFAFGKSVLYELATTAVEPKDRAYAARALIEAVRPPKHIVLAETSEDLSRLSPAQLEAEARQAAEELEPRQ